MFKKYFYALQISKNAFKGNYGKLVFWIILRGLALSLSPLLVPVAIQNLFNAIETNNSQTILETILFVICIIIPVYMINYFIYLRSDVWVLEMVFSWQQKCVQKFGQLQYMQTKEHYTDGDISQNMLRGSWSGVQAWTQLFRLLAPICTAIALLLIICFISLKLAPLIIVAFLLDIIISKYEAKIREKIMKKTMEYSGKREEQTNELIQNMQYHSVNGSLHFLLEDYKTNRKRFDKLRLKETYIGIILNNINTILERSYFTGINLMLYPIKKDRIISSGDVASANTLFENLRGQLQSTRSQIQQTINKAIPILKLDEMFQNCSSGESVSPDNKVGQRIECRNVCLHREHIDILQDISFLVSAGEKIAVIGKNGSGKSSLLRCIADIYKISDGLIHVEVQGMNRKEGISYVPANHCLFLNLSAMQNILLSRQEYDEELLANIMENGCAEALVQDDSREVDKMSGGEKQRLNVCRALLKDTSILLLDEPTSSLNNTVAEQVMKYILESDKTVLYTTHNPQLALLSDKILLLKQGKMVFFGDTELAKEYDEYKSWSGEVFAKSYVPN